MGGISWQGGVGSEVHLLIEGGIVITMDAERRIYDPGYVAIQGGKIVGTGKAAACPYSAKERLDASGKEASLEGEIGLTFSWPEVTPQPTCR
jgi:hypothetical protein